VTEVTLVTLLPILPPGNPPMKTFGGSVTPVTPVTTLTSQAPPWAVPQSRTTRHTIHMWWRQAPHGGVCPGHTDRFADVTDTPGQVSPVPAHHLRLLLLTHGQSPTRTGARDPTTGLPSARSLTRPSSSWYGVQPKGDAQELAQAQNLHRGPSAPRTDNHGQATHGSAITQARRQPFRAVGVSGLVTAAVTTNCPLEIVHDRD